MHFSPIQLSLTNASEVSSADGGFSDSGAPLSTGMGRTDCADPSAILADDAAMHCSPAIFILRSRGSQTMHFLRKTESTGLPQSGHIDHEGVCRSNVAGMAPSSAGVRRDGIVWDGEMTR